MKRLVIFSLLLLLLVPSFGQSAPKEKFKLLQLSAAVEDNLYNNIVPFWMKYSVDTINGGFFGAVDVYGKANPQSSKGLILNARILWTFSALYLKDKDPGFLMMAQRAYKYLSDHFIDREYGGAFYTVDKDGKPLSTLKYTYANAFLIYGLSEYYRATGDQGALELAKTIFTELDKHAHDAQYLGYHELFQRDWSAVPPGTRNDIGDADKSMNTTLHVMEAFGNLYRVWKSPLLESRLKELIVVTLDKIINPKTHRQYYLFNRDWSSKVNVESYGHDIESSWLMLECAEILGDKAVLERVKVASLAMAESTVEVLNPDGRLTYDAVDGITTKTQQWWVQAEAVVGYVNAWQLTGDEKWLDRAMLVWQFTDKYLVDRDYGEWFYGLDRDGLINKRTGKVSAWRCPYHNGRMCLEVIHRAKMD